MQVHCYVKQKGGKKLKCKYYHLHAVLPELYLELLSNQSIEEFIMTLKRLIARRGRTSVIYSDDAKIFVGALRWIGKIN